MQSYGVPEASIETYDTMMPPRAGLNSLPDGFLTPNEDNFAFGASQRRVDPRQVQDT